MEPSPAEAHWQRVLSGLRQKIDPVPVGIGYRLGLLLVAFMMVLLPLIYIALIVLAGYGVYWYAIHAAGMFEAVGTRNATRGGGRAGLALLVAYLGPLIAGAILVLFMIKPLFARRSVTHFPLSLSRKDEPLLFAFVERLCEVVGAPKPSRIDVDTDVNASASFREGWWGFLKKDLVLTIGLPLVAGMDLREFTGVLAHEFGHFAQGTGMRITYIIRSINGWFARVVYERDSWDEWLVGAARFSEHWAISAVVQLARFFVWLTRRILWLLMFIGHGVSSFMLRQMEFDADRYQARVTGSELFAPMMERVESLGIASQMAFGDLDTAWRERRLCDDFPSLIHSRVPDIPRELKLAIAESSKKGKTGWFDTHPAHADRNRSVLRENAAGIFTLDLPATTLFSDFRELSCRATVAFYHQALAGQVKPGHLVHTDSLVADRGKKQQSQNSLRRYFQDLVHPIRAVFPAGTIQPVYNADAAAETLLELRTKLTAAAPAAREAAKAFEKADGRLIAVAQVRTLRGASLRADPKDFDFTRADEGELIATLQEANKNKGNAARILNDVLADAIKRLEVALGLAAAAKPQAATAPNEDALDQGEYDLAEEPAAGGEDRLLSALRALRAVSGTLDTLRQDFFLLGTLLSRLRPENNSDALIQAALAKSEQVVKSLTRVHTELRREPYPYDHAEKGVSIARFAIPGLPTAQQVGDVMSAAESALDGCYGLYMRIMSDLSQRAEEAEASIGLDPLPEVTEEGEDGKVTG